MMNFVREALVKEAEPAKRESLAALQDELRKAKLRSSMGKTPVDLLIFDLDGTLIESKWDIAD
jgi:hypothetical protein